MDGLLEVGTDGTQEELAAGLEEVLETSCEEDVNVSNQGVAGLRKSLENAPDM